MCYFHVKKNGGFPAKIDGNKEHIEDLDVLAHVPSGYRKLWRNLFNLFTDKWQARQNAKTFVNHVKRVWEELTWSRAFLPPGTPQTNNASESYNNHLKRLPICKIRPSVHDCAWRFLQEIPAMSKKCAEKKFHANDDDRGYTLTELNYAIVYRSRLERNGNFLFPFWEDGKNHKKDIPDAVVFCLWID